MQEASRSEARQPISVVFVCLGNICRSTMAEGVFQHMARESNAPVGEVDSAGTIGYHSGDGPDSRTMKILAKNGINGYKHAAREIVPEDFLRFDYILGMDEDNNADLNRVRRKLIKQDPEQTSKLGQVMLFGDFGGKPGEEVMDPYYGAKNGFELAYEQMVRFSKGLLSHIEQSSSR